MMGLALTIRPGPLLLAGAAPWSELFGAGRHRMARAAAAAVAATAAIACASAVFSRISAPGAMMNANAAHTLYGIAHGTTWGEGERRFLAEDPSRSSLPEREVARMMAELALRRLLEEPNDALQKLLRDTANGVLALVRETPSALTRPVLEPAIGKYGSRAVAFLLLGLACMGLIQQLLHRQPVAEMTTWTLLATLASLPLIWGDGEWRGVTVSIPVLGAFLACATLAQMPACRLGPTRPQCPSVAVCRNPVLHAGTIACIMLPLAGMWAFETNRGSGRPALVVSLMDSDSVLVAREHGLIRPFGVPTVSHEDFCAALRRFHPSYGVPGPLEELQPPFLVTSHCAERRSRWTVVPGVELGRASAIRILSSRETDSEMVTVATVWEYVE